MTTFVRSAILSADYFCQVSYISRDGHFSDVLLSGDSSCAVLQSDCSLLVTDSGDCLFSMDKSSKAQL